MLVPFGTIPKKDIGEGILLDKGRGFAPPLIDHFSPLSPLGGERGRGEGYSSFLLVVQLGAEETGKVRPVSGAALVAWVFEIPPRVKVRDDVVRAESAAIAEFHVLAKMEGPSHGIRAGIVARRQGGNRLDAVLLIVVQRIVHVDAKAEGLSVFLIRAPGAQRLAVLQPDHLICAVVDVLEVLVAERVTLGTFYFCLVCAGRSTVHQRDHWHVLLEQLVHFVIVRLALRGVDHLSGCRNF